MKQSPKSARQNSADDEAAGQRTREPAQAAMADKRPAATEQQRQVAAMHNSPAVVAQQQRIGSMAEHTEQRLAQSGAGAAQLMTADAHGVAQLNPLTWLRDQYRRYTAKKAKAKQTVKHAAMGAYHGGGISTRYSELGAKSEQDFYDDELDKEAEGRERMAQHPVLEVGRMALDGVTGLAIDAGKDALNAVAPLAGTAAGKVVGMGKDHLNEKAKSKLLEGGNAYKVLRDKDEDD